MARISLKAAVCMVMLVVNVVVPPAAAATDCGTVVSYLNSCIPYVTGHGPLAAGCCNGVKGLYGAANSTPDRQSVCSCLKSLAATYSAVDLNKAAALPAQCGVSIPYKITPSTDCQKVQ